MAGFFATLGRLVAGPAGFAAVVIALFASVFIAPEPEAVPPFAGLLIALAAAGAMVVAGRALEARLRGDGYWLRAMIVLVPVMAITSGGPGRLRRLGLDQPVETPVLVIAGVLAALLSTMALLRLARQVNVPPFWSLSSAGLIALLFALAALSSVPALAVAPEITGSRPFLAAAALTAVVPVALVALSGLAGRRGRMGQRHLPPRR